MKSNFLRGIFSKIDKNSPAILTSMACIGVVSTAVMAVKATPKASEIVNNMRVAQRANGEDLKLKKWEVVKRTWKCYLPATIMGVATISAILGANSINTKRNAAIAGAYALVDTKFREYKENVVETFAKNVGDNVTVEEMIDNTANKRQMKENPLDHEVIMADESRQLCFDAYSGRYFMSTIPELDSIFVDLSRRLMNDHTVSLNEYFFEIGLEASKSGDNLTWHIDRGMIEGRYTSQIASDGRACIVVNFETDPAYIDFN